LANYSAASNKRKEKKEIEMSDYSSEELNDLFQTEPALTRADVREEVTKTLSAIAQYSAQTTAGVAHAVEEVSAQLPDFKERMPRMQAVLKEEQVLADAISQAESNPNLQNYLPPLYKLAYRLSQSPAQSGSESTQSEPESPRPSSLTEETIFAGTEASKRVNLSPQNRRNLIADLEARGILDVEF
jgi:hypothetical protein